MISGIGVSGRRTAERDQRSKRTTIRNPANKPEPPPHRDFNDKWDDEDDWPKKDQPKKVTDNMPDRYRYPAWSPLPALRRVNAATVRHPAQSAPAPPAHAATPAELYGLKCAAGRTVRHRWLFFHSPLSAGNGNAPYCSNDAGNPTMSVAGGARTQNRPAHARPSSLSACSSNAASGIASPFHHVIRISASRRKTSVFLLRQPFPSLKARPTPSLQQPPPPRWPPPPIRTSTKPQSAAIGATTPAYSQS